MRPVRLYWFKRKDGGRNFGDDLSPLIVSAVLGRPVEYATPSRADLAAVGSILDRVLRHRVRRALRGRFEPLRIWGSGFISEGPRRGRAMLDVLAVRGPLTRDRFGLGTDTPLGDPGILFSDLVPERPAVAHRWGVVAHHGDEDSPRVAELAARLPGSAVISVTEDDPMVTLRAIAACDAVVSSSLHGLIAADAFGIPNWRVAFDKTLKGGDFKFRDYSLVLGRSAIAPVPSDDFRPDAGGDFSYQSALGPHQERLRAALRDGI